MQELKVALISDIHGNLQALTATLQDISVQGVDAVIVLGDVATLGPNPREVIEVLQRCEALFVRGNHDDILVDLYENTHGADDHDVYKWAASKLSRSHVVFLKGFKDVIPLTLGQDTSLVSYHASPWSNTISIREHVRTVAGRKIFDEYSGDIFVGGHEHHQFRETLGVREIVSVGSAGFPYRKVPFSGFPEACAWSEYAIVALDKGVIKVAFKRVEYDTWAFRHAASQSDSPVKEWLLSVTN